MKSILFLLVVTVSSLTASNASACCLFPWLTGGYGWGAPAWGCCNYAPPSYGYQGYNVAPVSYSAGYYGSGYGSCCNSGCCNTGCCGSCGSSCSGSCGSSDCIGSETRKEPLADPKFEGSDRTFGSETDRGTGSGSNLYDRPGTTDSERGDGFRRPGTTDPGTGTGDWGSSLPGRGSSGGSQPFSNDPGGSGRSEFGNDILDRANPSFGTERGTNKPPMTDPLEGASPLGGENSTTPADEGDVGPGTQVDPKDFLSPDAFRQNHDRALAAAFRSRHGDVLGMERLAVQSRRVTETQSGAISTQEKKTCPAKWISVPTPEGRIRL